VLTVAFNPLKQSFEHVLANINKLNRSLEAVIAVCIPLFRALFWCICQGLTER
jgi:hypothetical protein